MKKEVPATMAKSSWCCTYQLKESSNALQSIPEIVLVFLVFRHELGFEEGPWNRNGFAVTVMTTYKHSGNGSDRSDRITYPSFHLVST
jgi:hypothetical protein